MNNLLNSLRLSRDFESVVSTISPLRQCWIVAAFLGFLRDHSASSRTIWTQSLHKTLHTKSRNTNGAHPTTLAVPAGRVAP